MDQHYVAAKVAGLAEIERILNLSVPGVGTAAVLRYQAPRRSDRSTR
jgi:hypothetical protein